MKIGDCTKIVSGYAFKAELFNDSGNGMPLVRIRDVGRDYTETYYPGTYSQEYEINNGDILIGMDGDFRISEWKGGLALLNQRVCKIIANEESIFTRYMLYVLPKELKLIEDATSFATVKHLSVSKIKEIQIPLPPLTTQKKIAAILDAADAYRQKTKALIEQYDRLAQSLFLEMFGDVRLNQKKWSIVHIEDVCSHIIDCPHSTPNYVDGITDYPCIRTSELKKGTIDWSSMKYLDKEGHLKRISRIEPKEGDIIYGREGSFGEAIIVPPLTNISLGQRVMLFRPKHEEITSDFFHAVIRSPGVYYQALCANTGSTVPHVNVADIKKFKIFLPPFHLQTLFADRITLIDQQKQQAQQSLAKAEALFNSLLQRAFKGELVS